MGVYYHFRNVTRNSVNEKVIPATKLESAVFTTEGTSHYAKFHCCEEDFQMMMFKSVVEVNGWAETDKIEAYPNDDDHPTFIYQNGIIKVEDDSESKLLICNVCEEKFELLSLCSKCRYQSYCSKECQVKDWPEHKSECQSVKTYSHSTVNGKIRIPDDIKILGYIEFLGPTMLSITNYTEWMCGTICSKSLKDEYGPVIVSYRNDKNEEKVVYMHRPAAGIVTEDNYFIDVNILLRQYEIRENSKFPIPVEEYIIKQYFLPAHKRIANLSLGAAKWLLWFVIFMDYSSSHEEFLIKFNELDKSLIKQKYGLDQITKEKFIEIRCQMPVPGNMVKFCSVLERENISPDILKVGRFDATLMTKFIVLATVLCDASKHERTKHEKDLLSEFMQVLFFEAQINLSKENFAGKMDAKLVTSYTNSYRKLYCN